ncbi:hypothetical protein ACFWJW_04045 [Streptomyces sp. NPDC127097]|uniref:hypothetical protein n=1 Tax=Streptomyces sp. NPDC127097 TaxID=3347136 RepID=UPI00364CCF2E
MFRRIEVAAAGAAIAVHGRGPGLAQMEQGAGGGVLGTGQSMVQDVDGGARLAEPDVLVRQIRKDTCSAVAVADLMGGVEGGAPVVADGGVVVVVEAVPPDRLGKGGRPA